MRHVGRNRCAVGQVLVKRQIDGVPRLFFGGVVIVFGLNNAGEVTVNAGGLRQHLSYAFGQTEGRALARAIVCGVRREPARAGEDVDKGLRVFPCRVQRRELIGITFADVIDAAPRLAEQGRDARGFVVQARAKARVILFLGGDHHVLGKRGKHQWARHVSFVGLPIRQHTHSSRQSISYDLVLD